jgi:hypothetical protein
MKFTIAVVLATALSVIAAPMPQTVPNTPNGSLTQMINGATSFSPNFLSGNSAGVAQSITDMVNGAASYAPNFLASLAGAAPKRIVQSAEDVPAALAEPATK